MNTRLPVDRCPSPEKMLAVVECPGNGGADADAFFRHLLICRECCSALAFVCEASAYGRDFGRRQTLWRQFQKRVAGHLGYSDRVRGSIRKGIDAIAAVVPACLTLQSVVAAGDDHFWRATMMFPEVDQQETPLRICVTDAKGMPLRIGTLVIFGIEIAIVNGVGHLSRVQLAECHQKGGVAFRWQDGTLVEGTPVLHNV